MSNKRKENATKNENEQSKDKKIKKFKCQIIQTKKLKYYTEEQIQSRITEDGYLMFWIPYEEYKYQGLKDWFEWWKSGDITNRGEDVLDAMKIFIKYQIAIHQWEQVIMKKIYVFEEKIKRVKRTELKDHRAILVKLPVKEREKPYI